ncbi:hypothetical protein RHMOL_Rhmol02G0282100 [Rhododendron molle]|uniref:Uncharacterized protein n=1 Tax=Rhododendron molle TaxID=49168 RepID=A0ACC0PWS7_RHOML|nr:hypothetical protein RHMOL_Rhmol02G0282100 [Rhododendron molle]
MAVRPVASISLMGNWADLGEDLLSLIAKRVALYDDFLSFGGVCRSWRSVAVVKNFRGSEQIPWLMLSEKDNSDERQFVSLRKGGVIRTVNLPEARGKRCLETLGWLVTISEDGEMNLLHPFSRVQIGLPHVTNFKDYEDGRMESNIIFMQKAVLSSRPEDNADFVLMTIYAGRGWLGFWRPGDKTWTTIESYSTHPGAFCDIIFHKGLFYGIAAGGMVFACDVWGPNPTAAQLVVDVPQKYFMGKRPYIVESAGVILVAVRDGSMPVFLEENSDDFDPSKVTESDVDYETCDFELFELDLSNEGKWGEKTSLGDSALFLGDNASVSVQASRYHGIKANCIYYTDDCWESYTFFKRGGGKDMGIFDLEDGSQMPCYNGESFSPICPPMWVNPSSL